MKSVINLLKCLFFNEPHYIKMFINFIIINCLHFMILKIVYRYITVNLFKTLIPIFYYIENINGLLILN